MTDDERWLNLAGDMARIYANCTRRKVGAVIVRDGHLISSGANKIPSKELSCSEGDCPRGRLTLEAMPAYSPYDSGAGICHAVHAEAYAIVRGPSGKMVGATMYCLYPPCHGCTVLIKAAQISRVVTPAGDVAL